MKAANENKFQEEDSDEEKLESIGREWLMILIHLHAFKLAFNLAINEHYSIKLQLSVTVSTMHVLYT